MLLKETLGEKRQHAAFREGGNRSTERYAVFLKKHMRSFYGVFIF
jgi:hypothetical protein